MQAAETIRGWGLQPIIGPHTNNLNVSAYAGTADERAADLLWALEDDSIKAVICSRGGYGSPVGSNSCIPLIEGAPCSLDVTLDKAVLSYNIKGNVEPYDVHLAKPTLIKELDL